MTTRRGAGGHLSGSSSVGPGRAVAHSPPPATHERMKRCGRPGLSLARAERRCERSPEGRRRQGGALGASLAGGREAAERTSWRPTSLLSAALTVILLPRAILRRTLPSLLPRRRHARLAQRCGPSLIPRPGNSTWRAPGTWSSFSRRRVPTAAVRQRRNARRRNFPSLPARGRSGRSHAWDLAPGRAKAKRAAPHVRLRAARPTDSRRRPR